MATSLYLCCPLGTEGLPEPYRSQVAVLLLAVAEAAWRRVAGHRGSHGDGDSDPVLPAAGTLLLLVWGIQRHVRNTSCQLTEIALGPDSSAQLQP